MRSNEPPAGQRLHWFHERYDLAARQIVEFLAADFIPVAGRTVADIGCGDGLIDLGLADRAGPGKLVGFDLEPPAAAQLSRWAAENGRPAELPECLEFRRCEPQELPAPDASFDLAFSWSTFHHLENPPAMVREIGRVLRPGGHLMIQLYPFFHSQHGSLLEPWFPGGFAQFLHDPAGIAAIVRADPGPDAEWAQTMLEASGRLNRLTLDELGRILAAGGFEVRRLALIAEESRIPPGLPDLPLSQLGIGGVKLTAERL